MKTKFLLTLIGIFCASALLMNCMSSPNANSDTGPQLLPGMNTSDPTKPNFIDPASDKALQGAVNKKRKENREKIIQLSNRKGKQNSGSGKTATTYYYGLLWGTTSKPTTCQDTSVVYMDDEDYINGSSITNSVQATSYSWTVVTTDNGVRKPGSTPGYNYWLGVTQPTQNGDSATGTKFRICKKSTTGSLPAARIDYAVFRMGDECPPGSYPFGRYFHNESSNGPNNNWYSGNIDPQWTEGYYSASNLQFCFVPKNVNSSSVLWHFSELLGVFAYPWTDALPPGGTGSSHPSYCQERAVVLTDDEDDNNGNSWDYGSMSQDYIDRIQSFMGGAENTQMFFQWCKPVPVGI